VAIKAPVPVPALLLLSAVVLGQGRRLGWADLLTALVGGVLVIAIPFVTMAAGMRHIPSGLGGILYAGTGHLTKGSLAPDAFSGEGRHCWNLAPLPFPESRRPAVPTDRQGLQP